MDDPRTLALAAFDRAVWIVTACAGDERAGLVATFVNSASLVPSSPRLIVGVARHHHSWDVMRRSRAFAAHLLGEDALALVWRFGLSSGRDTDKFLNLAWREERTGSPVIDAALAWLDCRVEAEFDIGDRTIFLGDVVGGGVHGAGPPLTASRVFAAASPVQRRKMDQDRAHDEVLDQAAIVAWRAGRPDR
jgi:flavin reductase (DIM6/NTAB) family NADH-FMN oxidoreductase RutF